MSMYVEPVAMIPWKHAFNDEESELRIKSSWLNVYPVIAAHANEEGIAFPGNELIGILAGMNRGSGVKDALAELCYHGYLIKHEDMKTGRTRRKYQLTTMYHSTEKLCQRGMWNHHENEQWFSIGRALIKDGNWGAMSDATRAVYTTLKANAWIDMSVINTGDLFCSANGMSRKDVLEDGNMEYYIELTDYLTVGLGEFNYLPDSKYEITRLHYLASRNVSMTKRTFRNSLHWLLEKKIIFYRDNYEGFILPQDPGIYFREIDLRLKRYKQRSAATAGAKRSLTALKKHMSSENQTGYEKFLPVPKETQTEKNDMQTEKSAYTFGRTV